MRKDIEDLLQYLENASQDFVPLIFPEIMEDMKKPKPGKCCLMNEKRRQRTKIGQGDYHTKWEI
jgi:hypothetical protein